MEAGLGWVLSAYGLVLGVLAGYAVSLSRRRRRLERDLELVRAESSRRSG